ncbi:hypothetical protein KTO58_24825 [Chitinophaga pendula]|uniref:hypothetical protein n=1 Tax=Chitinophaga TaxID=79328 RepID=UPI000BAF3A80|nr:MULTISPECIES: hypothetical protein [Chitinophaga]ASZ10192.1 hypothetical protein CK934_03945 [Chitinophaga sp. MD30]UCJ06852.1 hypothetical protein KTO58_24825 [Chitinophaga pendula]
MKYILMSLFVAGSFFAARAQEASQYCNERFSFCISYPAGFIQEEEAANGDGKVIMAKDGKAEIRTFGSLAVTEGDPLKQTFKLATSDLKLAYKVFKKDAFIISGTDKAGNVVYRKTVIKTIDYMGTGNTPVLQTLMITYSATQQALYAPYCAEIAKSL